VDELWSEIAEPFARAFPKIGIPLGKEGLSLYRCGALSGKDGA